jgi:hypothetical protein
VQVQSDRNQCHAHSAKFLAFCLQALVLFAFGAILLGLTQYRQQQIYREQRFQAPITISYPVARNKKEVEQSKVDVVIKHLDMKSSSLLIYFHVGADNLTSVTKVWDKKRVTIRGIAVFCGRYMYRLYE